MFEQLSQWFSLEGGLQGPAARVAAAFAGMAALLALAWVVDQITRRVLLQTVERLALRTETDWDDILVGHGVFARASRIVPAVLVWSVAPAVLPADPVWPLTVVRTAALVYLILAAALAVDGFVSAARDIYRRRQGENRIPTGGVVQLFKILVYVVAGILVVSAVLGRTPVFILSGLGAMTAVLILVFRDPLLGLVGGVHLTTNDMVRVGDWITMPEYDADGDVMDITLTSVKVRNFDKTITTVPTYSLISDSFKNWRGMAESGGRRIKRSLSLDMNSVRFVDDELFARLSRIQLLRDYLERKRRELEEYNRERGVDEASPVNGRRLTNLGCLRAYLVAYLREHPKVHDDMTFLVRQLPPGPDGIPLELYVFSREQAWPVYEAVQADIFDHLLAVVRQFDLRVFQRPAGADVRDWLEVSGSATESQGRTLEESARGQ